MGGLLMEHKVADPAPLGLAAFAMTTFCLSSANAGWFKGGGVGAAVALALIYGGTAQFAAGMWEFVRKNTFGALAFTSYGAFWIAFWLIVKAGAPGTDELGVFLLSWTIFTAYMTIASFKTNTVVASVFVFLTLTFAALTIGAWGAGHTGMTKAGGYLGIVTALLAWYGSAAGVINETHGKVVFPVGPLNG
jgi:succinate-acetate transporter protein